jgi:hypothetical protein
MIAKSAAATAAFVVSDDGSAAKSRLLTAAMITVPRREEPQCDVRNLVWWKKV